MIRVLIVDDHATFRADARSLLEAGGYVVTGEAQDAAEAVCAARRLCPDVILLDVQLPDRDGFKVVDDLACQSPASMIVLISSRRADDYGSRLRTTTAAGFIHKPDLSRAQMEALVGPPSTRTR